MGRAFLRPSGDAVRHALGPIVGSGWKCGTGAVETAKPEEVLDAVLNCNPDCNPNYQLENLYRPGVSAA
jgi:hypothetical protein